MKISVVLALVLFAAPLVAGTPDGGALFKSKCATCHGPDGSGQTAIGKSMRLRSLGSAEVKKLTDAQLSAIISDGKNKMPGYKGKLSPDEIRQIVRYIRTFKK